jgi:hypothetical protein
MSFDRQQDQFAIPAWDAGSPPVIGHRANLAHAMPVRVVARPADAQRGDAENAMPVYFVANPPVTGHRANLDNAIPIWLAAGPPSDPARRDRANLANAAPVYLAPKPPLSPPVNLVAPRVSGTGAVGRTLSTSNGIWTNSPDTFYYGWRRNGAVIGGEAASAYTLVDADSGATISSVVLAVNAAGSGVAVTSSNSVVVA